MGDKGRTNTEAAGASGQPDPSGTLLTDTLPTDGSGDSDSDHDGDPNGNPNGDPTGDPDEAFEQTAPAEPLPGDTVLSLYPLTYLEEGEEVTVGCAETDSYVVLPADGAALLRRLGSGLTLAETERWYLAEYGETVNLNEFVEALAELEFLRPAEESGAPVRSAGPVRWQRLGQALFSPVGWLGMAALVAVWLVAMVRSPDLRPANHDIFFTKYMSIIELVTFLGQFPLLLIHESFHALAGRRLGLRSTLSIGRRLYYVVFLTAMDGLVTVPRRKRYLPMLAGMVADTLVTAALTLIAAATREPGGALSTGGAICLALAYSTILRLMWQFYFYLETDLYYVAVTVLGCVDLQKTARAMLKNRWNRLRGRQDRLVDPETWHPRDRAIGRYYSWLVLGGWTFSLALLPIVMIPIASRVLSTVVGRLIHPAGQSTAGLADSSVFLLLNLAQIAAIWWLVHRDRARARTAVAYQHVLS